METDVERYLRINKERYLRCYKQAQIDCDSRFLSLYPMDDPTSPQRFRENELWYDGEIDAKKIIWGITIAMLLLWFFFGPRPWAFW
jgi:hypothetical protein